MCEYNSLHMFYVMLTYVWLCAVGRCGRPNDMLGIDGDVYKDKSLMLSRPAPWKFGSSFSSWIVALVGDPRLPVNVGGELGPESIDEQSKWWFECYIIALS